MRNEIAKAFADKRNVVKHFSAGLVYDDHPLHDPTRRIRRVYPAYWKDQYRRDEFEFGHRVACALWGEKSAARRSIIVRRVKDALARRYCQQELYPQVMDAGRQG